MPFTSHKTRIDCAADKLWDMMKDKIRRPDKYVPGVIDVEIVQEFGPDSVERRMVAKDGDGQKTVHETITADDATRTVIFKLKDDPDYTGYVINMIFEEDGVVELDYTMHWTQKDPTKSLSEPDWAKAIEGAVRHAKDLAEGKAGAA
ncbi:AtaL-like protein [Roseobacter weihaiensis]|uniref:AtaL-like protein n=1 Tax=Roseobacter weihaiensis TaxID=2763262 RepID=UPI001D0ACE10|nr:AtaL-like protein [Roseobacter sp. H9]